MKVIMYDFSDMDDPMAAPKVSMGEIETKVEGDCDHLFRVPGDMCLNCGQWDTDATGMRARIKELEARLKEAEAARTNAVTAAHALGLARDEHWLRAEKAEAELGNQIERYQNQVQELEAALLAANARTESERNEELARKFKLADIARRAAEADAGRLRGALESIVTVITAMGTVDDFGNFLILKNAEANFDLHETLEGLRSGARNALARQAALSPAEQAAPRGVSGEVKG